jgi:ATP-dependent RNA helicase RhlE
LDSNTTHHRPRRRRPQRTHHIRGRGRTGTLERPSPPPNPALAPTPCETAPVPFTALSLDSALLEGIRDLGFAETRPVQTAVIPLALRGGDVIACAETGSGKTCAFVVPILQRLLAGGLTPAEDTAGLPDAAPGRSRVLILAPTRELAIQIEDEIHGLSYHTSITSAAIYGGVEMGGQERALRAGVDIIVATPGRLIDHMRHQHTDLGAISLLVLDEADRMMDMGFWPDVRRILAALPATRQTLLFSATLSDDVVGQALEILTAPSYVQVGERSRPPETITHRAVVVTSSEKLAWLTEHLRRPEGPVLIFCRTKVGAERLARKLAAAGIRCASLHADRTQDQRRAAVEGFRGGRYRALVATDVAARGLDIDGIHTVVNYELPDSADSYVHRVGRTGRSAEAGQAITLVSHDERWALARLEKTVGVRIE